MKNVYLVITVMVLFVLCPLSVCATVTVEDSFEISSETRNVLSVSEDDEVIRVYFGYFMYGFSQRWTLEEIFSDGWSHASTRYVIASDDANGEKVLTSKTIVDGAVANDSENENEYAYLRMERKGDIAYYELASESEQILGVLGPTAKVEKTVFMHGYPHDGMYIYYETTVGDYVYYKDYPEAEKEYLVPIEVFYDYAKSVQDIRSVTSGGAGTGAQEFDLSPYDLSDYTHSARKIGITVLLYGVPVLTIGLAGTWIYLRAKRKG